MLLAALLMAASVPMASYAAGEHDMSGPIKSINHKNGVVVVKSGPSDLKLHFPPDAIKDLKKGDTITVHLGFSK
jgi:hypothetical protein